MIYCDYDFSLICYLNSFVIYYLSIFYTYYLSSFCFGYTRNFWNGRLNNIDFESLNMNASYFNLSSYSSLDLISEDYFNIDCFDCLIDYMRNFVKFFDLEIFRGGDCCLEVL